MKKLIILKVLLPVLILLPQMFINCYGSEPAGQQYYEIRIYHVDNESQEKRVDAFLENVFLPAYHNAGVSTVGVFKPVEDDENSGKLIYLFIPYLSFDQFLELPSLLEEDRSYKEDGKSFIDASYTDPPYSRYESILLKAFINMPVFDAPEYSNPPSERIYELRSYESATEARALKKIEMFNNGEIALFKNLGFNPLFFAEVLAGSHKPNLMYMITFSDMSSHDQLWESFRASEEWKVLSAMEEYKNTVSKADVCLLHPASYSDF